MKKKTVITIIIILLVLLVVWVYMVSVQRGSQAHPISYQDTANHFSITVPSNWKRTEKVAVETTGIGTAHETKQNIEIAQLFSVSKGIGITVQVYEGKPSCENTKQVNAKLAGLPATYEAKRNKWTLDTTTARFIIYSHYPGTNSFHRPRYAPIPTLPPQSVIKADQKVLNTIIMSTFKPKVLKPLDC